MKSGIYKITNLFNDRFYIGASSNISRRIIEHKNELKQNKHHNKEMQHDYLLYGKDNYEYSILEHCEFDLLVEKEQYWINTLNAIDGDYGYNKKMPSENEIHKLSESEKEILRRNGVKRMLPNKNYEEWLQERDFKKHNKISQNKPVVQMLASTGEYISEFNSVAECARVMGYNQQGLKRLYETLGNSPNRKKSYKGYVYVYKDNYDKNKNYRIEYWYREYLKKQIIEDIIK